MVTPIKTSELVLSDKLRKKNSTDTANIVSQEKMEQFYKFVGDSFSNPEIVGMGVRIRDKFKGLVLRGERGESEISKANKNLDNEKMLGPAHRAEKLDELYKHLRDSISEARKKADEENKETESARLIQLQAELYAQYKATKDALLKEAGLMEDNRAARDFRFFREKYSTPDIKATDRDKFVDKPSWDEDVKYHYTSTGSRMLNEPKSLTVCFNRKNQKPEQNMQDIKDFATACRLKFGEGATVSLGIEPSNFINANKKSMYKNNIINAMTELRKQGLHIDASEYSLLSKKDMDKIDKAVREYEDARKLEKEAVQRLNPNSTSPSAAFGNAHDQEDTSKKDIKKETEKGTTEKPKEEESLKDDRPSTPKV